MTINKISKGNLLISKPSLHNDNDTFDKSVILIADHSIKGSVGFILNKPENFTLSDIIPEINSKFKIYNGGPVEQESLYFLHNVPELVKNSVKICDGVYWGGDFSVIKELLNNEGITKNQIQFFLGYTGWGITQIESEIDEGEWIVENTQGHNALFRLNHQNLWKNKIVEHCPELAIWINAPKDPSYN